MHVPDDDMIKFSFENFILNLPAIVSRRNLDDRLQTC